MMQQTPEIKLHYCQDPRQALAKALELKPTVILQDLVMPELDGLELVKAFRAERRTRDIPLVMLSAEEDPKTKADAFALGANDYLVKLPDKLELIARIRYHSKAYINLLQRDEAHRKIVESQQLLAEQLREAAEYVRSLLPKPMREPLTTDWRFVPSDALGGDCFDYHWIDNDHLALYLIDVSDHGVGPALLSVSVLNLLRTNSLPGVDFKDPARVLAALNGVFRSEDNHDMFFTIWYGVYRHSAGTITYANGGHPPPLLFSGNVPGELARSALEGNGPLVGAFPGAEFANYVRELQPYNVLFVFSDGVFEIQLQNGRMWEYTEFLEEMTRLSALGQGAMDGLLQCVRRLRGQEKLQDDFSIMQLLLDRRQRAARGV
jgi:sigma-B regulation protein RsbU (phosphoserine phosphatase)